MGSMSQVNTYRSGPDERGHFGIYGGRFVAETLMPNVLELERAYAAAKADPAFQAELAGYLTHYVGRPSPLYFAERLTAHYGGAKIYLKREDLNHTGSHKINNAIGQVLLARRMGKSRIIAETGAGQHGVATATAAAAMGAECVVYMGEVDIERQALNVARMRLLGTEVVPVASGAGTLKDAVNEALREWVASVETTHYVIGSVVGPHPFPWIVRQLQRVIGEECLLQTAGQEPEVVVACVGGGSNAMGVFYPFADTAAELVGIEAAGDGVETGRHGASLGAGSPGILHGSRTYLLQDADGQVEEAHSISAGLDYPGVGPEHAYFLDAGLARYESITDAEALEGVQLLARLEGIIPALESAHAVAWVAKARQELAGRRVLINLSGRGDKDMDQITRGLGQ